MPRPLVAGLGDRARGAPPTLVLLVPRDRVDQPRTHITVGRRPRGLPAQLAGIDGVPPIMPWTVNDMLEPVRGLAHELEQQSDDGAVALLTVGTDQVGLPQPALLDDRDDGIIVIIDVNPIADVEPVAIEAGSHAIEDAGDLA